MVEAIFLALLAAKFKGYRIKPLFKDWIVYPIFILALLYIPLQIMIFQGDYSLVKYTGLYRTLYLFSFIALIIKYKLYNNALLGAGFVVAGTILNNTVMSVNGGKMPVFPTLSYLTGYVKPGMLDNADGIHALGSAAVRLKFLSDIFDLGYTILSIGDILVSAFVFIILYASIKRDNHLDEQ